MKIVNGMTGGADFSSYTRTGLTEIHCEYGADAHRFATDFPSKQYHPAGSKPKRITHETKKTKGGGGTD